MLGWLKASAGYKVRQFRLAALAYWRAWLLLVFGWLNCCLLRFGWQSSARPLDTAH